jgi:nitroimidazol reductase NimA-like FMN-containing flavoprotein (pyridoxamine 5'-phosphate oxidase superfamily)
VIASGLIEEITSPNEKSAAFSIIMDHYSQKTWEYSTKDLAKTKIWRIRLLEISGKSSLD